MNDASAGYRAREKEGYLWAKWALQLTGTTLAPWLVYPTANNMVLHSLGSRRHVPTPKGTLAVYLEFVWGVLCIKAGLWGSKHDARGPSQPTVTKLEQAFKAASIPLERPTQRDGNSVTLFKIPTPSIEEAKSLLAKIEPIWLSAFAAPQT